MSITFYYPNDYILLYLILRNVSISNSSTLINSFCSSVALLRISVFKTLQEKPYQCNVRIIGVISYRKISDKFPKFKRPKASEHLLFAVLIHRKFLMLLKMLMDAIEIWKVHDGNVQHVNYQESNSRWV